MGNKLARGYAVYTTQLRPTPGLPPVGLAWIDPAAASLALYAGDGQPTGTWPNQAFVGPPRRSRLIAAFNGGFSIYAYDTGWYDRGQTAVALRPGAASLVFFKNGSATVADWGRDVGFGPDVVAVRQNLTLLVDHGLAVGNVGVPSEWGAVLGGGTVAWRSGIGVTASGDLVYAGGPGLDPAALATALIAAHAVRAMELDINPEWVSFATFTHPRGEGMPVGTNVLPGTYSTADHYLQPYNRDFVAVFAR